MENLENIIEAILFALGREITIIELSNVLKIEEDKIKESLLKLEQKFNKDSSIVLSKTENGYALVTNKEYYEYVSLFIENTKRQNLSTSALEVLTIIAYNPKITKAEIESIRGVNSDFAVSRLLECGLVGEVARLSLPGRPAVYSVTSEFLRNTDINDVTELPEYDSIRVKDEQMLMSDLEKTESTEENKENK